MRTLAPPGLDSRILVPAPCSQATVQKPSTHSWRWLWRAPQRRPPRPGCGSRCGRTGTRPGGRRTPAWAAIRAACSAAQPLHPVHMFVCGVRTPRMPARCTDRAAVLASRSTHPTTPPAGPARDMSMLDIVVHLQEVNSARWCMQGNGCALVLGPHCQIVWVGRVGGCIDRHAPTTLSHPGPPRQIAPAAAIRHAAQGTGSCRKSMKHGYHLEHPQKLYQSPVAKIQVPIGSESTSWRSTDASTTRRACALSGPILGPALDIARGQLHSGRGGQDDRHASSKAASAASAAASEPSSSRPSPSRPSSPRPLSSGA